MKNKKVTITDIAKELNVSVALVSQVLNNKWKKARIGEDIARKVKDTAKKMNYFPNRMAQGLRKGKSGIIGLLVADISNPFFGKIARIIENEADKLGFQVMFGSSDEEAGKFQSIMEAFHSRQVDGLIVVPVDDCRSCLELFAAGQIPIVQIDRYVDELELDYVVTNNFEGSKLITEQIIQKGYRRIGALVGNTKLSNNREREEGFLSALKQAGDKIDAYTLIEIGDDLNKIREKVEELITQNIDVVYFMQNFLGIQGLKVINEKGIKIPEELAFVSFDDPEVFEINRPMITCYRQPLNNLSELALSILIDKIEGKGITGKQHVKLEGELKLRESY